MVASSKDSPVCHGMQSAPDDKNPTKARLQSKPPPSVGCQAAHFRGSAEGRPRTYP